MRILLILLMLGGTAAYSQTVQKCASSALEGTTYVPATADTSTQIPTITTGAMDESQTVPKPPDAPITPATVPATGAKKDD